MFRNKIILLLFFVLLSISAGFGAVTTITGKVTGGNGYIIRLMTYADQVTNLRQTMASATVNEDESFLLSADVEQTIYAWLDIEFRQAEIFLQPGKSYDVEIDLDQASISTSYYDRSPLPLKLNRDDEDHLNMYIRDFNEIYNDFMLNYAGSIRSGGNAASYNAFRTAIDLRFKNADNPYFRDYVRYSCAAVEMFLRLKSRDKAGLEYLTGQPLALRNVEYMDFFRMYFEKYFISGNKYFDFNKTYDLINGSASLVTILDSLSADPVLKDRSLRELVLLSGMKELYTMSGFSKTRILELVREISDAGADEEIRKIAGNLLHRFNRLKPGSPAPVFNLPSIDGTREYGLSDFIGKYVYLAFFDSGNLASQAELALIGNIFDEYKAKVGFVAISVDRDPSNITGNPNIPAGTWDLLYYDHNLDLLESYDAIAYPYFILIDDRGRIVRCPAPSPSEDIRKVLDSI